MNSLVIRAEQMNSLRESGIDVFIQREVKRLQSNSNPSSAPDAAWIRGRIKEAEAFGIFTEADLARYHDLALESGEDFPNNADRITLERPDLWGWQKLDVLEADRIFSNGHPST